MARKRQKISQVHLAEALGVSAAMVTKLKAKGMPTNSVAAARAWRDANLDLRYRKEHRVDSNNGGHPSRTGEPSNDRDVVDDVHHLQALARDDFDRFAGALQAAMRAVPESRRDEVLLDFEVMELLCASTIALFEELKREDAKAFDLPPGPLSDDEADEMGIFWYQVAAGEVKVKRRPN